MGLDLSQLFQLDFNKQLSFAYLACERMLPNSIYFIETEHFGNSALLREAIDLVYNSIFNDAIPNKQIDFLLKSIQDNTPNTNDFTTPYASLAMYSGGVIYESVHLLKKDGLNKILEDISSMPIYAVDLYIQERNDMDYEDPQFEEKIANDPLMQAEVNLQKGIILYLSKINTVTPDDIKSLLMAQQDQSVALKF